ncbi:hypothetical protein ACQKNX_11445 [Lysinibacillus sp. NPDC093712]|uniref:hypothetical protein n=1 Tax=Lysinibacillus sp. NPDC093712 TaxID=3390579 RepID=UPI003D06E7F8
MKRLSILLCALTLVFGFFAFSGISIATEETSFNDGEKFTPVTEPVTESVTELPLGFDIDKEYEDGEIISETITKSDFNPLGFYLYADASHQVYYTFNSSIPTLYPYEKWIDGYLYRGNLKLQGAVPAGKGYLATYSGKISTFVN